MHPGMSTPSIPTTHINHPKKPPKQLGPDAATLRGFLRHMPNHAAAHRSLKARMRDSRLALCKYVVSFVGGGW